MLKVFISYRRDDSPYVAETIYCELCGSKMNRRNVITMMVITIVVIVSSCHKAEPTLTVYLRCDEGVSGTLSSNTILSNGMRDKAKSFDISKVCKDRNIKIEGYQREKKLHFTFESNRGEKTELDSTYGRDVQSDQNGFYMVLKITTAPPFIANDKI